MRLPLSLYAFIILRRCGQQPAFIDLVLTESSDDTVFPLSEDQEANFLAWHRPHELFGPFPADQDDSLMTQSARLDLVQDITTDCSVVASLSAAAKIWTGKHAVSRCTVCCYLI